MKERIMVYTNSTIFVLSSHNPKLNHIGLKEK